MKVICAYLCNHEDRKDYFMSLMPYGITSIASFLEKNGNDVTLANFSQFEISRALQEISTISPEIIFISIFSYNRKESFKLIKAIRKNLKNIKIAVGGHHPTFLYNHIEGKYPEIDFIITGEGEFAALDLVNNIHKSKIIHGTRTEKIDSFPFPSLFTGKTIGVNKNEQFKYIITSRGCPSKCRYCSSPEFWKRKVTMRSPDNIVKELVHLQKTFGIIYFSIRDDNFTLKKARVMEFCSKLKESGKYFLWNCQARVDTVDLEMLTAMKSVGLEHIQFGVESGSDKILKLYDKSISLGRIKKAASLTREAGIYLSFYLMAGMFNETSSDIDKTVELINKTKPHDVIVSPVAYYPGTDIYYEGVRLNKIDDSTWFKRDDNGIYLNNLETTKKWIDRIITAGENIKIVSEYRSDDFKRHRQTAGSKNWVTDLMEGDSLTDKNAIAQAAYLYRGIISEYPDNPWGYLRLAEVSNSIEEAISLLKKCSKLIPNYYGVWQRMGELQYECDNMNDSKKSFKKAHQLNPDDKELDNLIMNLW